MREKIEKILSDIKALGDNPPADKTLVQNTYYLNDDEILCLERRYGESRFPYDSDGLVVWAHSSGYIHACESIFCIFRPIYFGEDSPVNFFGGIARGDGKFTPYQIVGTGRQLDEGGARHYVVYSLRYAYYITDTPKATFAVRLHVDKKKHIHFSQVVINKTGDTLPVYLSSYFEAILRFAEQESFWARMSKFSRRYDNNSITLTSKNSSDDSLSVNYKIDADKAADSFYTTAKSVFMGYRGRTVANAESLLTGRFDKLVDSVGTTELPVAANIIHFDVPANADVRVAYELIYTHSPEAAADARATVIDTAKIDRELAEWQESEKAQLARLDVRFDTWDDGRVNAAVMNKFFKNVQKQVSFCALGKNYAGPHIGIRDVFQQLEGSLMWQPERSREKIVVAMNYILSDGRPPRQFSIPPVADMNPEFDLHKYIDQGNWIISTIYTYLAFTGDFSILDEQCSYYEEMPGWVRKCDYSDSVLCHMLKIMDYLISNIDADETNCLRVLFGDWNDALDGLGKTDDEGREFGSGVTVMATLQMIRNFSEMSEILATVGGYDEKTAEYKELCGKMKKGLFKYAIDTNSLGERRIIHGWGDKLSYKVGSFCDPDGKARYSITSNAVWGFSDIMRDDVTLKDSILKCFDAVESKYGLKTFDIPFPRDIIKYVGRIATITPGTYENSCAYVHASMFAIMALFAMGESQRAWSEFEKSIVITHENASMTSFVMPNSYCENPEYNMDGESMGDWYTGSGTVLVKEVIKYGFGIAPSLEGLRIQTPKTMPSKSASVSLRVRDADVTLNYKNEGRSKRVILVNGVEADTVFDTLMDIPVLTIPADKLCGSITIDILD